MYIYAIDINIYKTEMIRDASVAFGKLPLRILQQ